MTERVVDPVTGGAKDAKPERLDQLPASALLELGRVAGYGLGKYGQANYAKGYAWSLSLAALHRHVLAWQGGENRDPDTGLHHLAHAAWHCLVLVWFGLTGRGTDDRMVGMAPSSHQAPRSEAIVSVPLPAHAETRSDDAGCPSAKMLRDEWCGECGVSRPPHRWNCPRSLSGLTAR